MADVLAALAFAIFMVIQLAAVVAVHAARNAREDETMDARATREAKIDPASGVKIRSLWLFG